MICRSRSSVSSSSSADADFLRSIFDIRRRLLRYFRPLFSPLQRHSFHDSYEKLFRCFSPLSLFDSHFSPRYAICGFFSAGFRCSSLSFRLRHFFADISTSFHAFISLRFAFHATFHISSFIRYFIFFSISHWLTYFIAGSAGCRYFFSASIFSSSR